MIALNQIHIQYLYYLYQHIKKSDKIAKVISKIDLNTVYDFCSHFYSSYPCGKVATYRPQDLIRSLIVMYLAGFTSINKWVTALKDTDRYAYLSGFNPDETPSKAQFSWFITMLFGAVDINDLFNQGILAKKIFESIFVNKSIELGIIDPSDKIIFDDCKVKSFCKQKYIPDKDCKCSHNKIKPFKCCISSDSEATKDYDHNLDAFLLGYGLHIAAAPLANNPSKCLPVTFFVTGADVHDSKVTTHFLMHFHYNMNIKFNYVIADSGYDAWYIYWWINLLGGNPIIAINPRNAQTPTKTNEHGLPYCPCGHAYYYWGVDKKKRRYKWRLPYEGF